MNRSKNSTKSLFNDIGGTYMTCTVLENICKKMGLFTFLYKVGKLNPYKGALLRKYVFPCLNSCYLAQNCLVTYNYSPYWPKYMNRFICYNMF